MDQGAFLDKILTMTLTDESLRTEILRFEEKCAAGKCKRSLEDEYDAIDADRHECLRDIDTFLLKHARDVAVTWLVRKQSIFGDAALPINRFLVSRLVKLSRNKLIALEIVPSAKVLAASWKNGRYFVQYEDSSGERQGVACSHAIIRYGAARRALTDGSDGPNESILKAFQETDEGFVNATQEFLEGSQSYRKDHSWCNRPVWSKEFLSAKDLPVESELFAEFVKLFFRPQEQNKFVYRIRIWLTGLAEELDVVYVLHPPDARRPNRRPVPRGAMDSPHEQWLNTALDYPIRVHSSDGREWYAGTVLEALRRHYRDKESSRVSDGGDILQTVEQAVATIESQTARNDVSSGL
jgi:hypothetical protein